MTLDNYSNEEILKEFKKRFKGTILGDYSMESLLESIGLESISDYLKRLDKRIVTYYYRTRRNK